MKNRLSLKVIVAIFILSLGTLSYANEKIVKVTTLKDYAPFCMVDKKFKSKQVIPVGKDAIGFKGYSWDILRESFHASGYTIQLNITSWARAMKLYKAGKEDILFPTGDNKERRKTFDYSQNSVNQANFVVYTPINSKIEWNGLSSLKGLKIGVKRDFNYGEKWREAKGIKKYDVNEILQGFKMLDTKRLDGFLGYEYNWDYALKQAKVKTKYKKLPSFDHTSEYLVALKSNPRAKEILKAYDEGFEKLKKSGRLQKIKEKWFGK